MPSVSPYAGTSDLVALGHALRGLRERRGLAQEAVGFDAGVGRNYVHMAELGQMNPAFVVLLGITRTLGATLPELIGDYQRELDMIDPHAGHDVPLCRPPRRSRSWSASGHGPRITKPRGRAERRVGCGRGLEPLGRSHCQRVNGP